MIPLVGNLPTVPSDTTDPKAVAAKVQAMFMEIMIKAMEDSVGAEDGLFGSSNSAEIYRGMLREQLGASLSEKAGGSLRDELERGMQRSREKLLNVDATENQPAAPDTVSLPIPMPIPRLPVEGIVTSEVGWRKDPFTGAMSLHKGTDIAAPKGTLIHAVASGVVVESGAKGSYGNAVVIRTDDGRRMLYGHNSTNFVQVGARVQEGETIAAVGATGKATGPHVHFEVME